MPRISRKRTRSDEPVIVKVTRTASRSSVSTKKKNSKLISGHTNVDNKRLTFSYAYKQITTLGGVPYHTSFRANSPYDPDPTLGGNSAYGFSQMALRYRKYYVKSSRMRIVTAGYNNTKIEPMIIMWADNRSTHSATDLNSAIGICKANGGKVYQMGHVLGIAKPLPGVGMRTSEICRGGFGDEDNQSAVTTNPTNEVYYHLMVFPISTSDLDAGYDCNIAISIDYETMFFDPVDQF